jgi:glycosyltransferase involved in cell wall biosynthesis
LIKISVIIPTYNRLERLILVFEALRCQTLSPHEFEVIVVSDGSCDGTDDYLHSLQVPYPFTPIFQPNQGVAVARNQGLAQAKGEVVLFLDDDVIPADHLVAEHLLSHESSNGDLVIIGSMITPEDFEMSPWVRWEQDQLAKQYQDMLGGVWETTARQFYTGNTSLSRMRLLESGGFDPEITRAEDVELAYRLNDLGLRFIFNPQAVGYHYAERSFESWATIAYTYGRNDVIFTQHKKQTWLLPAILKEYNNRNPLTRGITRLCLGKPLLSSAAKWGLKMSMEIGDILKMSGLTHISCSGIFNLQHYQGIADELGGRKAFYDALNQANNRENLDYSPALPIDGNH